MGKVRMGIALYQIEKDGCLNGIYTNEYQDGKIHNEVARKQGNNNTSITGKYDCLYFDSGNSKNIVLLEITLLKDKSNTYNVSWKDPKTNIEIFDGIGYIMNEHQFVVSYGGK